MLNVLTTKLVIKGIGGDFWEVMDIFMALMVVRVSQVYTYPRNHQIVYIKYVHLCTCPSYLNSCHSLLVASHFNINSSLPSKALQHLVLTPYLTLPTTTHPLAGFASATLASLVL